MFPEYLLFRLAAPVFDFREWLELFYKVITWEHDRLLMQGVLTGELVSSYLWNFVPFWSARTFYFGQFVLFELVTSYFLQHWTNSWYSCNGGFSLELKRNDFKCFLSISHSQLLIAINVSHVSYVWHSYSHCFWDQAI